MQLVLEKRAERSNTIALVSPLIAIGLTIVTMSILFAILGKNPVSALGVYFIDPLTDGYSLQEIAVKATPLVMIAIGLALCYLANAWNIGAEGQFLIGAVAGSWLAVKTQGTGAGHWVLPAMLLLGAAAGALYALIPAICKVRFGASEILRNPAVLVVSQPTWGVDAGAAAVIRQALLDLAAAGAAVLVTSQDLDELAEITDRIAVMFHGHLSEPLRTADASREKLGLLMGGSSLEPTEAAHAVGA